MKKYLVQLKNALHKSLVFFVRLELSVDCLILLRRRGSLSGCAFPLKEYWFDLLHWVLIRTLCVYVLG